MPATPQYPYKIRAQFTGRQRDGLRAASAHFGIPILGLIRRYVSDGLKRDGFDNPPPAACEGQSTIDL